MPMKAGRTEPSAIRSGTKLFAQFDGLLDAVADRAAAYTDEQLAQLHDLVTAFREIVADYATDLRARPRST